MEPPNDGQVGAGSFVRYSGQERSQDFLEGGQHRALCAAPTFYTGSHAPIKTSQLPSWV